MAQHQMDPTFFVESDDDFNASTITPRQAAKMIARRKQDLIGNELSRLAADEYLEDVMQHMAHMEEETVPDVNLIDMQREIQWFMRPYLIDFLVEAHAAFALLPETLYLTINLLDRYCAKRIVYKQHYQLVGCAALLIAAKYGDKKDRVPQIHELNNMCCGLYDSGMFTQMEMHVLNTLDWSIGHPTVDFFAQLMVAEEQDDQDVDHMAAYMSEIAMYHRDFVSTKPSTMARASLVLARAVLGRPEVNDGAWDQTENVTLLTLSQHLHRPSPTLARKYSSQHLSKVSQKLADFMAQQAALARRNAEPPTPPTESVKHSNDVLSTPQKGNGAPAGFDGYLTPPITPDGHHFANAAAAATNQYSVQPPRCPVTPSHGRQEQQPQQYPSTTHGAYANQHYINP
ncbi:Cyclin, C-terminal domain [Geosmithia morbida]|uniref:Cyclin, C-terminal domain n=1 Tax=Geosmithia morbida TaxID=1094350 RepID=A0A9P4Z024_9HYPO|nr:Cyclin, C-terminal domain [Geosmithia morbida]KAF4125215.1 Cyclin, C-terminal domain [Geosmithia morbida]